MPHVKISGQNPTHFNNMNSYQSGLFAELLARWFLRLHGFRILRNRHITGRNTGRAEIDIIARRGNLVVFAEVKSRPTIADGIIAVTAPQAVRLRRAAENCICHYGATGIDARFDIIVVSGMKIRWVKNAI
jgi:putative endonuclease